MSGSTTVDRVSNRCISVMHSWLCEGDSVAGCGWDDVIWAQHLSAAICIALTYICSGGADVNVFTGAVTQPLQLAPMCQQMIKIKEKHPVAWQLMHVVCCFYFAPVGLWEAGGAAAWSFPQKELCVEQPKKGRKSVEVSACCITIKGEFVPTKISQAPLK